jgi:4-amino-4-deoxy-L-arabinose transferase-like glycosyltransferase
MGSSCVRPDKNHFEIIKDWCRRHPHGFLALLTVLALTPFLAKPFNMDDPLYVWAAQRIQLHPGNPYGFEVNWFGFSQPMWAATQNPPLMSYYLAVAAGILGWSEIRMHFACLLPAVAVVLGTYRLAKSFCRQPQLAAAVVLFAPGFLVSATTVMCDVVVLAFWIWAVVFWTEGVRENNLKKMTAAGALAALALLTKYNGASLIPLLAAYGWLEKRAIGRWIFFLLIPVAAFFAYEWLTCQLYGQGLFSAAMHYAKSVQGSSGVSKMTVSLNALTFTGGGFAAALFCAPLLWRKQTLILLAASTGFFVALTFAGGMFAKNYDWITGGVRVSVEAQIFFWSFGGVSVLALAVVNAWLKRDAEAWLLALWVLGTFTFAAFFNWTVNLRSLLPMAPAVAILIVRRLEQNPLAVWPIGLKFSIAATVALSLLAAQADFQLAGVVRKGAEQVCAKYAAVPGKLWFQGHWGFQFYMQSLGAHPLDFRNPVMQPGDILVIPNQNSNVILPDPQKATPLEVFALPVLPGLADWCPQAGAGFYSTIGGPLPIAFGRIPQDKLFVYILK